MFFRVLISVFLASLLGWSGTSFGVGKFMTLKMSTTTSTENSGLLDVLLPEFTKKTGIRIMVFAKGTGAAIHDGMEGNVDLIFVHAKKREEEFVAKGYGAYRLEVMYNDFVLVGPSSDPAGIRGLKDVAEAFKRIALKKALFISRGDQSGTHIKEQEIWRKTGVRLKERSVVIFKGGRKKAIPLTHPEGLGEWYLSIGQGMGKTLTFAEEKRAYTLTDRGTYLKFKFGRAIGLALEILCQGDPRLHNPYGVIPLNPNRFPHVKFAQAERFARWLVSPQGQGIIGSYKIAGRQVFFPAHPFSASMGR